MCLLSEVAFEALDRIVSEEDVQVPSAVELLPSQHVEAVLKVSLSLEPSGTILDGGGVEVVVSCEKDVNCHERGSYRLSAIIQTNRLQGRPILRLKVDESEREVVPVVTRHAVTGFRQ